MRSDYQPKIHNIKVLNKNCFCTRSAPIAIFCESTPMSTLCVYLFTTNVNSLERIFSVCILIVSFANSMDMIGSDSVFLFEVSLIFSVQANKDNT